MNKRKAVALALAWLLLAPGLPALALDAEELVPLGEAVGIRLQTEGVLVAGLADVETAEGTLRPAEAAGLRVGDVVTAVDGKKTDGAAAFLTAPAGSSNPKENRPSAKVKATKLSLLYGLS